MLKKSACTNRLTFLCFKTHEPLLSFSGKCNLQLYKNEQKMRVVIQRVSEASVKINGEVKGKINIGMLVLAGFTASDTTEDLAWISRKLVQLRIFNDPEGKMNLSLQDVNGEILVISQFTLYASTKKGNRPSYINAATPAIAIPLYEQFIKQLEADLGRPIQTGEFGADMKVSLLNDGPVTIIIDSQNRE